jgi:hypothetical protein
MLPAPHHTMELQENAAPDAAGFSLFATTWAIAGILHQMSFVDWRWHSFHGGLLTAALLWVLLRPSSWVRFAALLLVDCVAVGLEFPVHPNHIVFAWVVNLTLLTALLIARIRRTDLSVSPGWYRTFAPWLRVELAILYFFTVFHKINGSYFNIDWSCASIMYRQIASWLPLMPSANWSQYCAVYGTLLIEVTIPILLFGRRTRIAGAVLGMLFHGVLALYSFPGLFSFSATMTALYTVFIPPELAARIVVPAWLQRFRPYAVGAFAALGVIWLLRDLFPASMRLEQRWDRILQLGFLSYCAYQLGGLLLLLNARRHGNSYAKSPFGGDWRQGALLGVFPVLLCVNGFGPYLGLRTQSSLSMFSNLQTEEALGNHLIVPAGIQLTDWQSDLVEIVDSNNTELLQFRDDGERLPYLDLRRRRGVDNTLSVTFRRHGDLLTFASTNPETDAVLPPLGWLAQRYFFFRAVDPDPIQVRCKH